MGKINIKGIKMHQTLTTTKSLARSLWYIIWSFGLGMVYEQENQRLNAAFKT